MKRILCSTSLAALLLPAMLGLTSCETCKPGKPGPITSFPIQVALSPTLQGKAVTVDVVGVNKQNRERWEAYSMTKYWKDGDPMRTSATKKTLDFTSTSSLTQTLPLADSAWAQWKSQAVTHIFVLVDLPGVHNDMVGSQDARRQMLSLDMCDWPKGTKELKVIITEGGPQVTPLQGK